jgi:hypothetical protein
MTRPVKGPSIEELDAYRYLPKQVARPLYQREVRKKVKQFRKTRNPALCVEIFLLAKTAGVAYPAVILKSLHEWFKQWYESQGKIPLDEIMGLKPSRGKTPPYLVLLLEDRDRMLFDKVARLKSMGVNIEKAVEIVDRGFEAAKDWNKSLWKLRKVNADTIARNYWKWPERKEMEQFYNAPDNPLWTAKHKRDFLRQFPPDSLPQELKEVQFPRVEKT